MSDDTMTIVEFSEDISEAEAPEPLPVGEYPATIKGAEVRISNRSGNKYAAVQLYVSPDEFPADYPTDQAPDGKTLMYMRLVLEDDGRSRYNVRKFCEAIGAPMSRQIDVSEWVGSECRIHIEHDEWEGNMRENVTRVEAA